MNAPESRINFGKPIEPFGKEASAFMKALIQNKKIRINLDVDYYDRYNRVLAYCYTEDSVFLT
mgnify:CR=1 FL=1